MIQLPSIRISGTGCCALVPAKDLVTVQTRTKELPHWIELNRSHDEPRLQSICLEPPYLLYGTSRSWIWGSMWNNWSSGKQGLQWFLLLMLYRWCRLGHDVFDTSSRYCFWIYYFVAWLFLSYNLTSDIQFSRTSGFLPNNLSSLRHVKWRACNIRDTIFTGNKRTAEWHFRNRGVRVPCLLWTIDKKRATRHKLVCSSPFLLIFRQIFWLDWHLCSSELCMPQASNL